MQYRIKGFDQIIEAENPYEAAYKYFILIDNKHNKGDEKYYSDWFTSHLKYVVDEIENTNKYLVNLMEYFSSGLIFNSPITYLKGDATEPVVTDRFRIITHICNDKGAWGAGFVMALSKKWKEPEAEYRKLKNYVLGDVQFVQVNKNTIVANIIGQHCTGTDENGNPPIRYNAVRKALKTVNSEAIKLNATIHSPYMGCGLAGGIWGIMEAVILETITVPMYIYEF